MKNQLSLFAIAAMLIFGAQSCKKEKNAAKGCSSDGSANYPHLAVGHRTDYHMSYFLSDDDTISWTITDNPSAGTYFVEGSSKNGSAASLAKDSYWHACGNDYYISTDGNYNQYGNYWFSLDANVGDKWTRTINNVKANYELISKNATITTTSLGQTFTGCWHFTYNQEGTINTDDIYFTPELGIVAYEGVLADYELVDRNF